MCTTPDDRIVSLPVGLALGFAPPLCAELILLQTQRRRQTFHQNYALVRTSVGVGWSLLWFSSGFLFWLVPNCFSALV